MKFLRITKCQRVAPKLRFCFNLNSLLLDLAGRPRARGLEGSAPRGAVNPLNYGNSLKLTKVIARGPRRDLASPCEVLHCITLARFTVADLEVVPNQHEGK